MIIRFGGRHVTRMRMRSSFNYALVLGTRHRDCRTPYRTDDPEPTPLGHYEFYTFSTGTVVRDDTSGSLPAFELNYGPYPQRPTHYRFIGATQSMQLSFKYRFIQEDEGSCRGSDVRTSAA
jgi:hypothetical protein